MIGDVGLKVVVAVVDDLSDVQRVDEQWGLLVVVGDL